jgi:hypothetical protein
MSARVSAFLRESPRSDMQPAHRPALSGLLATLLLTAATAASGTAASGAEASVAEQISQAASRFEEQQTRDFKPVGESLDRWRRSKYRAAAKELAELFDKAAPADKSFIAYHVLSVDPKNKPARALFVAAGIPAPFDEKGVRLPEFKSPACRNRQLVDKVANLKYPPFGDVAEVVSPKSPTVQSYWKRQRSGLEDLRKQMIGYAEKGQAPTAYQMLAFYWPGAKEVVTYFSTTGKPVPRQRTWFPDVDRYLLDHELAGIDCLDARTKPNAGPEPIVAADKSAAFNGRSSWDFMEFLRNCRIEGNFTAREDSTFAIVDAAGKGASLTVKGGKQIIVNHLDGGKATMLAEAALEQDLSSSPYPLQFEVRGRKLSAQVAGVPVLTAELPADYAYKRVTVDGHGLTAQQLRVRFLADKIESADDLLASADLPKTPVAKAPEEAWRAERQKQLDRPVTFKFDDTTLDDAVAFLAQVSGVKITMDAKAETLKTLPVTLVGNDMKLQSALEWLQRVSDLAWQPTADGITLTWNK